MAGRHVIRALQPSEWKKLYTLAVVCLVCAVGSCATTQAPTKESTVLSGVPFFKQDAYQCGPAALAAVLDYWYGKSGKGRYVTPEDIVSAIYSPSARGVLGIDLELYAQRQGFITRQYRGSIGDLREQIDQGVPAIILVDYGISLYQINHFLVITGHGKGGVLANTGRRQNEFISEEDLDKVWKKTGYWMLVLKPPA